MIVNELTKAQAQKRVKPFDLIFLVAHYSGLSNFIRDFKNAFAIMKSAES